jgi:hypothetical protein
MGRVSGTDAFSVHVSGLKRSDDLEPVSPQQPPTTITHPSMANLRAATTSSGAQITDRDAVRALCECHSFGELNWELTDDGQISFWGYTTPDVLPTTADGKRDHDAEFVTIEFMRELAQYLAEGEVLDIQAAGYTKCRYPMYGYRLVVTSEELRMYNLFANGATDQEPRVERIPLVTDPSNPQDE